jgi:hypothetical protein
MRDALHLAERGPHQSLDQALHLVGFGPECVRKASFDEALVDRALGHDLREASDPILDFLVSFDPEAHRYGVEADHGELPLMRRHRWNPELRYETTGEAQRRLGEVGVVQVVAEARRFVDERVLALWCDGAVETEALR